ncbi:FAD-binding protein [Aquimarina sp. 2201CG14-23]|uniref:FAD-binding protein n=1 Tax=Aquimarina mycalae TaxID=3040073 RepID=UPI00247805BE|nr:FAD-binding protein [Aquimarina sp. 2201CG14-23]MDH7444691.1 FAD-binding protein [Aquimarina sp. 2201CG14-23]
MIPEGISLRPKSQWTNSHENFTQKLIRDASFKLRNPKGGTGWNRYRATTRNFQWLINHAIDRNIRLRALGRGWSFSKVGVTDGGIIDTLSLTFSFRVINQDINAGYAKSSEDLYFLQCGTKIHQINTRLSQKKPQRSIKASGGSNGQTIAGALSTGTHGAAFKVGAIQDFVVGLHIVSGADKHVWIERASYPVASNTWTERLEVDEVIKDDEIFNAALVSFGSFGFIHGVMIETESQFLLEERRIGNIPFSAPLKKAMTQLDFSDLVLEGEEPNKELYHFEVLFNLHNFKPNNTKKGAFLKYMFKMPYDPNVINLLPSSNFKYGEDLLGIISSLLDRLSFISDVMIPPLVNVMFKDAFKPRDPQTGTIGQIFNFTKFRGQVASAAIGITAEDSARAVELIMEVNKQKPFPGGFSLRYVKGTKATLGFTKFSKTCVLEMDGLDGKASREFLNAVWSIFEEEQIPYTLHWGKINFNLNEKRVKRMYGTASVASWIDARNHLMTIPSMSVFTNEFMEVCGLDKTQGEIV